MRPLLTADEVAADRDAWLARRRAGIGASDIGAIMRLDGSYGGPWRVWMDKTGRGGDTMSQRERDKLDFCLYCENWTAYQFQRQRPDLHVTDGGLYCHDDRPWQIATFDRLAHEARPVCGTPGCYGAIRPTATVQLKTDAGHKDWREGMPLAYWAQNIWEMNIAAAWHAFMPTLDRAGADVEVWEIEWTGQIERELALMLEAAEAFLDLVKRDVPPEVDELPATTQALKQLYADVDPDKTARIPWRLACRWRRAGVAERAAHQRKRRHENEVRARTGDAGRIITYDPATGEEVLVANRRVYPRAGYSIPPAERVDGLYPNARWTP